MPLFGVHESIASGFDEAVFAASTHLFDTVQIFSKNSNQWNAKPIDAEAVERFQIALETTGLESPIIHDSYLINVASPKGDLRSKSVAALIDELERAKVLGISNVIMHPGAYTEGDEKSGLRLIAESLDAVFKDGPKGPNILLETTAGQGTNLGHRFEHLAEIIQKSNYPDRLGVCLDTCHVFAAGYSFATPKEYDKMMAEFDSVIGLDRLKAFHLNDSVRELGSRVDRHEAIGFGKIGREPFGFFVNDPRFAHHAMYLETPKGTLEVSDSLEDWDAINLRTLRELAGME